MEVRGLGLINVRDLFGVASTRTSKRVELVVQLERWDETHEYDRLGLDEQYHELLGLRVPLIRMPVAPGRNLGTLVEVAARNQLLRARGINAARDPGGAPRRLAAGAAAAPRSTIARTRTGTRGTCRDEEDAGRCEAGAPKPRRTDDGASARFIVLTGLSGAGKSQAIRALEDLGYYCVDNLPVTLLPFMAEFAGQHGTEHDRIAVVMDVRESRFVSRLPAGLPLAAAGQGARRRC